MNFNKIVFVRYFPLTKAIYTDLYFEHLENHNFKVEYLDVTQLFNQNNLTYNRFDFKGTIEISSYSQLKKYLGSQNNDKTLYISIMSFEWRILKLLRIFTKFNLKLGVFARGVFPSSSENKKSTLTRYIKFFSLKKLKLFSLDKLAIFLKKIQFVKSYDYIFKAGEYGYWGLGLGSRIDFKNAKIIEINTVDYDKFLENKEKISGNEVEYLVFLDQYLPYHPDAAFLKIEPVEATRYFKEINSYFDIIESTMGIKVIIAAHPKAERYLEVNPFNGREIWYNKSNDLVKDAVLVLTHASTAICFPICYEKRIGLLMSNYINKMLPHFTLVADSVVSACDATFISMDKANGKEFPAKINKDKYYDFKYKYLTSVQSENKLTKDIFINFLLQGI